MKLLLKKLRDWWLIGAVVGNLLWLSLLDWLCRF